MVVATFLRRTPRLWNAGSGSAVGVGVGLSSHGRGAANAAANGHAGAGSASAGTDGESSSAAGPAVIPGGGGGRGDGSSSSTSAGTASASDDDHHQRQAPLQGELVANPTFPITRAVDMRPLIAFGGGNPDESFGSRWTRRFLLAAAGAIAGFVAWDVDRKEWSDRHTWSTALKQYALFKVTGVAGRWRLRRLLAETEEGEAVQRRLLSELLARHQSTEYGRERGLTGVATFEDFRRAHPLTRYGDYAEFVERVRLGREGVLAPGLPKLLAMTSGTSGKPNLIPHAADVSKTFFLRGVCVAFAVLGGEFPGSVNNLQRSSKLTFRSSKNRLPNGLELKSNSSSPDDRGFSRLLCAYASPLAAYDLANEPDAMYAHALFALSDRNLGQLEANFAPLICALLETAQENRRSLVQDIRNGHIWDRRLYQDAPEEQSRDAIDDALGGPNPKRAAEVDDLLRARATAAEIWPKLRVVMTTDGGAFAPAAARLRKLLGDGVEVYSPFYAATEGLLGINLFPQRPFGVSTYVLDPGSMVFELLPVEWRDVDQPPRDATVLPWEADVGQTYEIVITTRGGLCRYRLGDIVRVHGLFGQMPIVSIEERAFHSLPTLHGERLGEGVFLNALASTPLARRLRGAAVVDLPGKLPASRYHLFAELADMPSSSSSSSVSTDSTLGTHEEAESESEAVDAALCRDHEVYASFRRKEAIRRLQIHWVAPGTFASLRQALASRGGADLPSVGSGQLKVPTVLRGEFAEKLFAAAVCKA
eukprot:TRINITY_DN21940_c0_g1_i1.p1 TRINITY_DN21940_c0_g1~~TRINITY_DN21940_c0_g1_i1.p1  ORF type:complete len:771 (-),score=148.61 TRINITY_DN21940_c0_g1_i1:237-2522(-)